MKTYKFYLKTGGVQHVIARDLWCALRIVNQDIKGYVRS